MSDTQTIEELVLQKHQAVARADSLAQLATALVLLFADDKGVVRVPKAILNRVQKVAVDVEELKSGSLKLTLKDAPEQE